jgi:photosystem II stability/assembly factor-like uncharacterized protein
MKTININAKLITTFVLLATSALWTTPVGAKIKKNQAQGDEPDRVISKANTRKVDDGVTALKGSTPIQASSTVVAVTDIGPEGGNVLGLEGFVIDPGNSHEILASTGNSGVFKSTDDGKSWHSANVGLTNSDGRHVSVPNIRRDPSNPRTVYAVSFAGLFRSTDFGEHWSQLSTVLGLNDVAVSPTDPSLLFAVSQNGFFYKSTDGGGTLVAQTGIGLPERDPNLGIFPLFTNVVITPANPQTMYVVDESSGVYKSTDAGASFTVLESSTFLQLPGQVFPHPTQRDTIFLECLGIDSPTGLFRSTDGGATFTEVTGGLPAGTVQFVTFDPENPLTVYAASSEGLLHSTDGGFTFTALGITPAQLGGVRGGAVVIDLEPKNSNVLYVNTGGANFKSVNGGKSFAEVDTGFRATHVRAASFDNYKDPSLYVVAAGFLFRTGDRGRHYDKISLPIDAFPTAVAVDPNNRKRIVVTTENTGILVSTDGGRSWSRSVIDIGASFFRDAHIAFDPQDTRNVYVASGILFRSKDGGQTFTHTVVESLASALAIDPQHPNVLYLSGSNGLFEPELLKRSDNSGVSFTDLLIARGVVNALAINPHDTNIVYAGGVIQTESGEPYPTDVYLVVRSTDNGVTFTPADYGLSVQLLALGIDPVEPTRLYALCPAGLFKTEDSGTSWSQLDSGGETSLRTQDRLTINPTNPKLLYLGGTSLLEVEIKP